MTSLFISASIPAPTRWDGAYDANAITDAVVAFAREALERGWTVVTAAHPTIAPLVFFVAQDMGIRAEKPPVVVYQSALYSEMFPEEIAKFESEGFGRLVLTEAAAGEVPEPGRNMHSLFRMRRQMLEEQRPRVAVFIGGMEGINDEWDLVADLCPDAARFALFSPGGAAAGLVQEADALDKARLFPALAEEALGRSPS
jgi:hypothetical protein